MNIICYNKTDLEMFLNKYIKIDFFDNYKVIHKRNEYIQNIFNRFEFDYTFLINNHLFDKNRLSTLNGGSLNSFIINNNKHFTTLYIPLSWTTSINKELVNNVNDIPIKFEYNIKFNDKYINLLYGEYDEYNKYNKSEEYNNLDKFKISIVSIEKLPIVSIDGLLIDKNIICDYNKTNNILSKVDIYLYNP